MAKTIEQKGPKSPETAAEAPISTDTLEAAINIGDEQTSNRAQLQEISENFLEETDVTNATRKLVGRTIEIDNPETGKTIKGTILEVTIYHDHHKETNRMQKSRLNVYFSDKQPGTIAIVGIRGGQCLVIAAEDINSTARIRIDNVSNIGHTTTTITRETDITKETKEHIEGANIFDPYSYVRVTNEKTPVTTKEIPDKNNPDLVRKIVAKQE